MPSQERKYNSSLRDEFRLTPYLVTLGGLSLVFAGAAHSYSRRFGLALPAAASIYLAFLWLLALVLTPGFWGSTNRDLPSTAGRVAFFAVPASCVPYLLYVVGTGDFRFSALLKLLAACIVSLGLYGLLPVKRLDALNWQDICLALALPAFVLSGQLKGIWNTPVNLDFMSRLLLIAVAAWAWVFVRPVPALGYTFCFGQQVFVQAGLKFLYFSIIAVPLSLALHFTAWNPRWHGAGSFALDYLEIFLFVALLEELFFRGFLQTLLSGTLRNGVAAQLFVSGLFGLFHILHAPFPNWRYVTLASLAGWFYGSAFRKTGNLMASTMLHAAVDTVWRTWLNAR